MPSLTELKGVGDVTADRLEKAGVNSVTDLARSDIQDLIEHDISETKAARIIGRAAESALIVQTGDEAAEDFEERDFISSGIAQLDDITGGGFQQRYSIGIEGPSSSGKTQLVFEAMVSAIEQTGLPAIYIETEPDRYQPDRLQSLANEDDTQEKCFRIPAHDLESELRSYAKASKVPEAMGVEGISMIAIDSFTAPMRLAESLDGRGNLKSRSTVFAEHFRGIFEMMNDLNCPVLMTLQVYGNPTQYGSKHITWAGELVNHLLTYRLQLSEAEGSLKHLKLVGHPGQKDDDIYLSIQDDRIVGKRNI